MRVGGTVATWKPRQVVKGCENDLVQGQLWSRGSLNFLPVYPRSLFSQCINVAAEGAWDVWSSLLHLPPMCYKWECNERHGQFGRGEISSSNPSVGGELPRRTMRGLLIGIRSEQRRQKLSGNYSCLSARKMETPSRRNWTTWELKSLEK